MKAKVSIDWENQIDDNAVLVHDLCAIMRECQGLEIAWTDEELLILLGSTLKGKEMN